MSGNSHHPDRLDRVGGYNIDAIRIHPSTGEKALKIEFGFVTELNIYEDIQSNAITGSMEIVDTYNLIGNAELQGNERLSFILETPGRGAAGMVATVDASEETGYPFFIYSITDRRPVSETTMTYTIYFCSNELARNTRLRVNRTFDGDLGRMAVKILKDPNGLNTKKPVFFEPTRNQDTVLMPNLRPFDAINLIAKKALSGNANGAGYYFYETAKGFYFRSVENMLAYQSTFPRPQIRTLKYERPTNSGDMASRKLHTQLHNVQSFEFINKFDTLANQALGTYASRVITYNIFDKSYAISDYDYHRQYGQLIHTDTTEEPRSRHNYPIARNPIDNDPKEIANTGDKTISDYPESRIILQPSTRYLHGDNTGVFGTSTDNEGLTEAIRISQKNQVHNSTVLKLVIPGLSEMQAGDVIRFDYPRMEPNKGDLAETYYPYDPKYSGRYLITKLRHRVIQDEYQMVLECIKDSVYEAQSEVAGEQYYLNPSEPRGAENLYEKEDGLAEVMTDDLGGI